MGRGGGSIFLVAVGAILAFAVDVSIGWLDLWVVGWVLMIAGALGLILTVWLSANQRRRAATGADADAVEEGRSDV